METRSKTYQAVATYGHSSKDRTAGLALTRESVEAFIDDPVIFWARFWARVEKVGGHWLWTGAHSGTGYGQLAIGKKPRKRLLAHRVAFVYFGEELSGGDDLLHSCDNPLCVRPEHLRRGDQAANMHDKAARGRCVAGDNRRKLDAGLAVRVRAAHGAGASIASLARAFDVTPTAIHDIVARRSYASAGA